MHDLPPQGSIEDIFLPRLLASLHVREFEGVLRLVLPEAVRVLYFKKGEIASAASNAEPDRLANILIREGRLTGEQLELARSRLQAGASLGKTLIEMGFLSPSELLQGARQQVHVIVAACFAATRGDYEMVPGPLPAEVTSLGLNTRRLLFDCLMEAGDRAAIIREVGSMEAVYRPTGRMNFALTSLRLDDGTDRIGRLLNGTASLRVISGRTSHDDLTVCKVVLALDLLGAAERVTPAEEAVVAARGRAIPIVSEAPLEPTEPAAVETADADGASALEEGAEARAPSAVTPALEEELPGSGRTATIGLTEAIGTRSTPLAPDEPAADEPPPIPPEELPAFAQPLDEPRVGTEPGPDTGAGAQWEIDEETGERVHVGPIEMTFDGRIAPGGGESRSMMWVLLGAGAVTLVVAGALGYVMILRRGAGAPSEAGPPVASRTATTEPVPATAVPTPTGKDQAEEPARAAAAPGAPTGPAGPTIQIVPPVTRDAPEQTPESRPRRGAVGPIVDPRFGSAQRRLDQGDPGDAARLFDEWILSEDPRLFTMQLMIACQEDTVRSARSRAGPDGSLFILPYSLGGRSCYRVLWGLYEDGDSARAAAAAVPSALSGGSVPLVVPLSRLRPKG